jgi:hypothetical protein
MGKVLKALLWLFLFAVVGVFTMLAIAQHSLATARIPQDVVVVVATPGFSLASAEREVAEPLEQALSTVQGVESLRSTITSDVVTIAVHAVAIGVEAPSPASLIRDAIGGVTRQLPTGIEVPYVQVTDADPPTRYFIARSDSLSRLELSRWLDEAFRRELEVQNGVRGIELCGALRPELKVTLDPARLKALGLRADEVVSALQSSALQLPTGSGIQLTVRSATQSMESIEALELRGARLRDVARLELGGEPGPCSSAGDVLVSVRVSPGTEFKLPSHPAVKLSSFVPLRTATFLSAPGNSVTASLHALATTWPGAVITAEGDTILLRFPEEPTLKDLPGLALRSMNDEHAVVRVSGPDFAQLTELAAKLRTTLEKEHPRWLGVPWPGLSPQRVITPAPGARDVALALRLAIVGVETGALADGTPIRVRAGSSIEDAVLPDGRPLSEVVQVSQELAPAAMLRVNRQRVVELELGLDPRAVMSALKDFALPPGVSVSASPAR